MTPESATPTIAVFCDFENVAIGCKDARYASFDVQLVLARLLDKGNVVVRKAYADWAVSRACGGRYTKPRSS